MRELVAGLFITLDGITESPDKWQFDHFDDGLAEEVGRLKRQPGKNIGVAGSPTLVRSLLELDLLDELKLMLHPVVAGRGKRLFPDGASLKRLKLDDSKTTPTGVLIATYRPRGEGHVS